MPKSLLVIGSGAIGIEFASFYRNLGAEVTVVEVLPRILPGRGRGDLRLRAQGLREAGHQDPYRRRGRAAAEGRGQRHRDDSRADGKGAGDHRRARDPRRRHRRQCRGLGLEGTGVKVDKGHIVVDEWCRTGEPGVYAIGDVAGPPWLAHKASHEGVICVEKIAGRRGRPPAGRDRTSPAAPIAARRWRASA